VSNEDIFEYLGKLAYDAYCESVERKSISDQALPSDFNALPERIRKAWTAAAQAVADKICEWETP
jgi:hypothetical protein